MSRPEPSRRLQNLSSAIFSEMAQRKQEAARKFRVIDLGIGSPDQPPAPHLIQTLTEAVQPAAQITVNTGRSCSTSTRGAASST